MNSRSLETRAANLIDSDIASTKHTLPRRWLLKTSLLALAGVACKPVEAAGINRVFVPMAARDAKDGVPTSTPERTPTPTVTPTPESTKYSPWPTELALAMNRVVVLDNVHLVRSKVAPTEQPGCVIACYLQHSKEVWIITPPLDPNAAPELVNLSHELGHSHQQKIRESQGKTIWQETTEFLDFSSTLDRFNAWLRARGDQEWKQDPYELFANIFAGYILGDPAFTNEPSDWNKWVPNPYQFPELQSFMDRWAKKT